MTRTFKELTEWKETKLTDKTILILTIIAIVLISLMNMANAHDRHFPHHGCHHVVHVSGVHRHHLARHWVKRSFGQKTGHKAPKIFDLVPQLADKVADIIRRCGSQLISGYRPHAVVAGTHHASLHSLYPSRAADIRGNPSCAYALLADWPGGYSTDYGRVSHIHISYSPPGSGYLAGREWHSRFAHGGHHRYAHRRRSMRT